MKIVFVYRNHENLGIGYLSSTLKNKGHETDLVLHFGGDPFFGQEKRGNNNSLVEKILGKQPDLIAFSSVTDDFQFLSGVAKGIKKQSNIPVIFGGVHAMAVPERVIDKNYVDFICTGEGEEPLLELANRFEDYSKGKKLSIPGIWHKKDGKVFKSNHRKLIQNLDSLPFPDKELFYKSAPFFQDEYLIVTSRGCPYKCTYCYNWSNNSTIYKKQKRFRRRSVDNVIEELLEAKNKWKIKRVFFFDDTFTASKKWVLNFLQQYGKQVGLEFSCVTNINFIDKKIGYLLRDAGCIKICVGVETWNEELRRNVLHRVDDNENIYRSIAGLKETGMYVQVDHLLGIPGETAKDHITAIKTYNKLRPNHISVYWMKYYPGIEIVNMLKSKRILSKEDIELIEEGTYSDKSYLHGGSLKEPCNLFGINLLLNYLPIIPASLINLLLKIKLDRFYRVDSYVISNIIPRILKTLLFTKDVSGRHYIKKFFFLLKNGVTG